MAQIDNGLSHVTNISKTVTLYYCEVRSQVWVNLCCKLLMLLNPTQYLLSFTLKNTACELNVLSVWSFLHLPCLLIWLLTEIYFWFQNQFCGVSVVFSGDAESENLSCLMYMFRLGVNRVTLCLYVSAHSVDSYPFHDPFSDTYPALLRFMLVILLVNTVSSLVLKCFQCSYKQSYDRPFEN